MIYFFKYFGWDFFLIGKFLFPVWLFQGMQRMKYITIIQVIAKIIFTCSIFLLVKDTNDVIYAIGSHSFGVLFSGIFSIFIAYKMFSLKFYILRVLAPELTD